MTGRLITRDTDYAVRAIGYFAASGKNVISAAELSENLELPRAFSRKILQLLRKARLVKSHRGRGGGFSLLKPPEEILLFDLIEVFQGKPELCKCFFRKSVCPDAGACVLKRKMDEIEKYVISELKSVTLAHLAGSAEGKM